MKNFKVLKLTAAAVLMSAVFSSNCPPTDPLDHTVFLPNPDDCRSFYMCSNGVPILQICPEGLHFNAHLDCCDWPEKAGCEEVKETGAGLATESECRTKNGYWGMALVCSSSGVVTTSCEISGQITIFGITLSGAYKKGNSYQIGYENWTCINSANNCCIASSQGLRVK